MFSERAFSLHLGVDLVVDSWLCKFPLCNRSPNAPSRKNVRMKTGKALSFSTLLDKARKASLYYRVHKIPDYRAFNLQVNRRS